MALLELFYLFNARYITASILNWEGFTGNRYALIAIVILMIFQMGFTYLEPLQVLFGTAAIDHHMWLRIVLVASSVLFLVELEKRIVRYRSKRC